MLFSIFTSRNRRNVIIAITSEGYCKCTFDDLASCSHLLVYTAIIIINNNGDVRLFVMSHQNDFYEKFVEKTQKSCASYMRCD